MTTTAPPSFGPRVERSVRSAPIRWPFWVAAIGAITSCTFLLLSLWRSELAVIGLAFLPIAIVSTALFISRRGIVSIWFPALISVAVGVTARSTAAVANYPDESTVRFLVLRQLTVLQLVEPLLLLNAFLGSLVIGYAATIRSRMDRKPRIRSASPANADRTLLLAAMTILGIVGLIGFVRATGGFDASLLSAKRDRIVDIDAGTTSTAGTATFWRYLGSLAGISLVTQFALFAFSGPTITKKQTALTALMFLVAAALPFYGSQRGEVLALILSLLVILALAGHRLRPTRLAVGVLVGLLILNAMTGLRSSARDNDLEFLSEAISLDSTIEAVDAVLLNRSLTDVGKTAQIYYSVSQPGGLEPANGSTLYGYVFAPIPRALWPGKPLFAPGPIIGRDVYGSRSGVPPGLAAELYWNFGFALTIVLGIPIGAAFQIAERRAFQMTAPFDSVQYAVVLYPILGRLLGGAVGGTLLSAAVAYVTILLVRATLEGAKSG